MRVFVPLISTDLAADELPVREVITPTVPSMAGAEQVEEAEFEAATDASLASLELIREADGVRARRIVAALETPAAGQDEQPSWSDVDAFLIDDADAEEAVRAACQAQTQEEADAAVSELVAHPLAWWDALERQQLADHLAGN